MGLIRPATLLLAGLLASPALWHGFVTETLPVQTALIRYLIAVPFAMIVVAVLQSLAGTLAEAESRLADEEDADQEGEPQQEAPAADRRGS